MYQEAVIDGVAQRCTEVDSGARNVDHILTHTLLPEISREMLSMMAKSKPVKKIEVGLDKDGFHYTFY